MPDTTTDTRDWGKFDAARGHGSKHAAAMSASKAATESGKRAIKSMSPSHLSHAAQSHSVASTAFRVAAADHFAHGEHEAARAATRAAERHGKAAVAAHHAQASVHHRPLSAGTAMGHMMDLGHHNAAAVTAANDFANSPAREDADVETRDWAKFDSERATHVLRSSSTATKATDKAMRSHTAADAKVAAGKHRDAAHVFRKAAEGHRENGHYEAAKAASKAAEKHDAAAKAADNAAVHRRPFATHAVTTDLNAMSHHNESVKRATAQYAASTREDTDMTIDTNELSTRNWDEWNLEHPYEEIGRGSGMTAPVMADSHALSAFIAGGGSMEPSDHDEMDWAPRNWVRSLVDDLRTTLSDIPPVEVRSSRHPFTGGDLMDCDSCHFPITDGVHTR